MEALLNYTFKKNVYFLLVFFFITFFLCSCETVNKKNSNSIEKQINMLFSDTKNQQENTQKIIELLPNVDWILYDKENKGSSFELLEWVAKLDIDKLDNKISILKSTNNLDGVCAEEYSYIVGNMYVKDMKSFLKALATLSGKNQKLIYEYVSHYCSYLDLDKIITETEELSKDNSLSNKERKCATGLLTLLKEFK